MKNVIPNILSTTEKELVVTLVNLSPVETESQIQERLAKIVLKISFTKEHSSVPTFAEMELSSLKKNVTMDLSTEKTENALLLVNGSSQILLVPVVMEYPIQERPAKIVLRTLFMGILPSVLTLAETELSNHEKNVTTDLSMEKMENVLLLVNGSNQILLVPVVMDNETLERLVKIVLKTLSTKIPSFVPRSAEMENSNSENNVILNIFSIEGKELVPTLVS